MSDQSDQQKPRRKMSETEVVNALRSTSIGKHPTAFINTQLPVLEIALNVEMMTAKMADLLKPLARPGMTPAVSYAKLLAYKQGNRGLIHYEVTGTTYGELCLVYGKLYPELVQAERVNRTMQALWKDVYGSGSGDIDVPRALGCLADLSMLVYVPVDGTFLGDALASDNALRYMDMSGHLAGHAAPAASCRSTGTSASPTSWSTCKPGRRWSAISIPTRPIRQPRSWRASKRWPRSCASRTTRPSTKISTMAISW